MSVIEITRSQQRIDELFKLSTGLTPEMSAHWSRYLCILVAGFLEVSLQEVYSEYSKSRAHPNVVSFVSKTMRGFQNPNMNKISELARSFNSDWAAEIDGELSMRDSVNSILANRHQIAHGKSTDVTVGRLQPWYRDAIRLVDMLRRQCEL